MFRQAKPHVYLTILALLQLPLLTCFPADLAAQEAGSATLEGRPAGARSNPFPAKTPTTRLTQEDLEAIVMKSDDDNPYSLFFVRRSRNTTAVIDRANVYDYQAAPIRNSDGTTDVWYCGHELTNPTPPATPVPLFRDAVYKARLNSSNALVGSITLAVPPSGNHGVPDGYHACDVSVIKHHFDGVTWPSGTIDTAGEELYYMYYECAPRTMARGVTPAFEFDGVSEICLAASVDGTTWMKYNNSLYSGLGFGSLSTVPTPVVTKHQGIIDLCDWAYNEAPHYGKYVADYGDGLCGDWDVAYGAGHPSAISMPQTGTSQREVWLYYYENRGSWESRGMVLRKSEDGIHFDDPIDVVATDAFGDPYDVRLEGGKIRYYNVPVAGYPGVFIATPINNKTYFAYSFDGEHFVVPFSGATTPDPLLRLAESRADDQDGSPDLCVSPGYPAVVANKYGIVDQLSNVELLSNEGKYGSDPMSACYSNDENTIGRGATWGMYYLTGDFGEILNDSVADPCAYYDGRNVRDQKQRSEPLGSQDSIYWVKGTKRYTYSNWSDFLAKNGNNPNAYLDISNDSFDRVDNECTSGGVRPAPVVATNDSAIVAKGLKTKISVLTNDTGGIDAATVAQVAAPSHGTISISGAGVITYTHDGGVHTSDSFTYKVKDTAGLYSNTATVTVAIKAKSLLYRVNAGGSAVTQTGGNWAADTSVSPSTYVNAVATGNYTFSVGGTITADGTVPSGTSVGIFNSSRYDQLASPNLIWSFPISAGAGPEVEVKVYFAETYYTSSGQRKFAVKAEGVNFLTEFDIYAAAGAQGTMRGTTTSTDGTLNVEFVAGSVSVPHLNGIEVWGPVP